MPEQPASPADEPPPADEMPADEMADDYYFDPDEASPTDESYQPPRQPRRGSGWGGCALWALAALVVIIGGCVAGLELRPGNTWSRDAYGNGWTLQSELQADKSPCLRLEIPEGQLSGQCAYSSDADPTDPTAVIPYTPTSATVNSDVVTFGPVPKGIAAVRLKLADGSVHTVKVGHNSGVNFFVYASPVANEGPTLLLGPTGKVVPLRQAG